MTGKPLEFLRVVLPSPERLPRFYMARAEVLRGV